MAKVKTWVWVVIGIFVAGVLCLIAMAAAGLWFAKTHIDIRTASATTVAGDFEKVHQQFASQKPLIELDERGHYLRSNTERPNGDTRPESLNVLAFNPDDGRMVRVNIPFWMLRLKMRGTRISVGRGDLDLEDMKLTVEDLERFGPTLILDHTDHNGQRVLVWSQ